MKHFVINKPDAQIRVLCILETDLVVNIEFLAKLVRLEKNAKYFFFSNQWHDGHIEYANGLVCIHLGRTSVRDVPMLNFLIFSRVWKYRRLIPHDFLYSAILKAKFFDFRTFKFCNVSRIDDEACNIYHFSGRFPHKQLQRFLRTRNVTC